MSPLERISGELRESGYEPTVLHLDRFGRFVVINYHTLAGRYRGQSFKLGIGFQEDSYPEYPPHFIAVANLRDSCLPVYGSQVDGDDAWAIFSVPPSDFWDSLSSSDKNMKTYLFRHVARFWSQV